MKNHNIILSICLLALITACSAIDAPGDSSDPYAPMYKYLDFPAIKIHELNYASEPLSKYYDMKTELLSRQGIVSNNCYFWYWDSGTNYSVVFKSSNNLDDTWFFFPEKASVKYLCANDKYVVFITNNVLKVMGTNSSQTNYPLIYQTNLGSGTFIAEIGKGESSLLCLGKWIETDIIGSPNRYSEYTLTIIDFLSNRKIDLPKGYDILGFSPNNKYLFFNYFSGILYSYSGFDYPMSPLPNQGILAYYDIQNKTNLYIGNLQYDIDKGNSTLYMAPWSDSVVGITSSLTKIYVLQVRTIPYPVGNLDDGLTEIEERGLWEVDISSLGLTE
jgi:hypothetical protein